VIEEIVRRNNYEKMVLNPIKVTTGDIDNSTLRTKPPEELFLAALKTVGNAALTEEFCWQLKSILDSLLTAQGESEVDLTTVNNTFETRFEFKFSNGTTIYWDLTRAKADFNNTLKDWR